MTTVESLKTGDGRKFGVRIIYEKGPDGIHPRDDAVDPLDDYSISETETEYLFDNGYNVYSYKKADIKDVQRYESCQVCGFPVDNCRCPDSEGRLY